MHVTHYALNHSLTYYTLTHYTLTHSLTAIYAIHRIFTVITRAQHSETIVLQLLLVCRDSAAGVASFAPHEIFAAGRAVHWMSAAQAVVLHTH